jgi:hypothetical protein
MKEWKRKRSSIKMHWDLAQKKTESVKKFLRGKVSKKVSKKVSLWHFHVCKHALVHILDFFIATEFRLVRFIEFRL